MAIFTDSAFYYGHNINANNQNISLREPYDTNPNEKIVELNIGSHSLTEYVDEIATRISDIGSQEYTATVDRFTRQITISADQPFELLVASGSTFEISAFNLMGFSGDDRTGLNSYTGDLPSGKSYEPQFKLHNYVDFKDMQRKSSASISESASGVPEIISFGKILEAEFEIMFATNINQGSDKIENPIRTDQNGYENLRDFMIDITDKNTIEIILDKQAPEIFHKALLQKTTASSQGIAFQLKEMRASGLRGYFRSGKLTFREL